VQGILLCTTYRQQGSRSSVEENLQMVTVVARRKCLDVERTESERTSTMKHWTGPNAE
jgi:hypothetical protein